MVTPPTDMLPFVLPLLASSVQGFETWCGKYYEVGSPRTPPAPESRFTYPSYGDQRLVDFRCSTASSIYLPGDDSLDPPAIIFDAAVSYDYGQPGTSYLVFIYSVQILTCSLRSRGRVPLGLDHSRFGDCIERHTGPNRSKRYSSQLFLIRPGHLTFDYPGHNHMYRPERQLYLYRYHGPTLSSREPI
jgi:hypothetical protein